MPEYDFDIVCPLPGDFYELPPNVHAHDFLAQNAYEKILASADAAFGGLALHRIGITQASPLKVREYLLHGVPVVIGYEDPDLRGEPWYVLKLPNSQDNVDSSVEDIRRFVAGVAGRRITAAEVTRRIDIVPKERRRLAFLESVARGDARSRGDRRGNRSAPLATDW
jgi:hypothetical protein